MKCFSVLIVTYNQEKYIKQAIDSVLSQDLNLITEIVICDDNSIDNTNKIIADYALKYPNLIKHIISDKNERVSKSEYLTIADVKYTNIRKNYINGILQCSKDSKYIAILEGDDYWLPNKLEKIYKYIKLDNNKHSLYFHKYDVLQENTIKHRYYLYDSDKEITVEENIKNYQIQNLSCSVYDTKILKSVLDRFLYSPGVDYPLNILCLEQYPALFVNEILSVYRISQNGSWAAMPLEMQSVRNIFRRMQLNYFFNKKYDAFFTESIYYCTLDLINNLKKLNICILQDSTNDKHKHKYKKEYKIFGLNFCSIITFTEADFEYISFVILGIPIKFKIPRII